VTRWIAPAIAVLACGWVVLLVIAPLLPVPLAGVVYAAGSLICHQIAERSFHIASFQLPVCARCFGLYAGAALGGLGPQVVSSGTRAVQGRRSLYGMTLAAALPTMATWTLEWGAGWPMSNVTRALAAVPLGATVAFAVTSALPRQHWSYEAELGRSR
jgi:hypothetical protein